MFFDCDGDTNVEREGMGWRDALGPGTSGTLVFVWLGGFDPPIFGTRRLGHATSGHLRIKFRIIRLMYICVCLLGTSGTRDIRENEFLDGAFIGNMCLLAWDIGDFLMLIRMPNEKGGCNWVWDRGHRDIYVGLVGGVDPRFFG